MESMRQEGLGSSHPTLLSLRSRKLVVSVIRFHFVPDADADAATEDGSSGGDDDDDQQRRRRTLSIASRATH